MEAEKWIKVSKCVDKGLYVLDARNFNLGVFNREDSEFTGVNYSFGDEFLFGEVHFDRNTEGTAKPLELLEICPLEHTQLDEMFIYIQEKRKEYENKLEDWDLLLEEEIAKSIEEQER